MAPYHSNQLFKNAGPGVITGLAYTPVGGEILQIECTLLSGRGRITLTGTLGVALDGALIVVYFALSWLAANEQG